MTELNVISFTLCFNSSFAVHARWQGPLTFTATLLDEYSGVGYDLDNQIPY